MSGHKASKAASDLAGKMGAIGAAVSAAVKAPKSPVTNASPGNLAPFVTKTGTPISTTNMPTLMYKRPGESYLDYSIRVQTGMSIQQICSTQTKASGGDRLVKYNSDGYFTAGNTFSLAGTTVEIPFHLTNAYAPSPITNNLVKGAGYFKVGGAVWDVGLGIAEDLHNGVPAEKTFYNAVGNTSEALLISGGTAIASTAGISFFTFVTAGTAVGTAIPLPIVGTVAGFVGSVIVWVVLEKFKVGEKISDWLSGHQVDDLTISWPDI